MLYCWMIAEKYNGKACEGNIPVLNLGHVLFSWRNVGEILIPEPA